MKKATWIVAAALAAWAGGAWAAGEADDIIQQAIRGANTNTEKAQKLLDAAEIARDDSKLATTLIQKAAEYSAKDLAQPGARELTEKALDLLASKTTPTAESWSQRATLCRQIYNGERSYEGKERAARKLVSALMELARLAEASKKYQAACEAYAEVETVAGKYKLSEKPAATYRARRAKSLLAAEAREKQLQAALKANAADTKSRMGLLKLLVLEKDAPEEALRWLADDVDQTWQANVKLASGDPSALAEAAARELGDWYYAHMQASDAAPHVKGAAAGRAQTYYTHFLGLHTNQDQPALKAKLALKEIEAFVASTGTPQDDGSIDLLANIDTTKNVSAGQWGKNEIGLAGTNKDWDMARFEIPPPPQMPKKYELTVTFARVGGNSTVAIVFPFADNRQAVLVLDNYGQFSGLEHLDTTYHYYGPPPPKRTHKPLDNKKAYTATIVVTPMPDGSTRLAASLNGQEVANWTAKEPDQLSRSRSEWKLRSQTAFGLGINRGQVIFNKLQLKPLK